MHTVFPAPIAKFQFVRTYVTLAILLAVLTMFPQWATAQDSSSLYSGGASGMAGGQLSVAPYGLSSDANSVESQVSDLRLQLATQSHEITTLKSQVNRSINETSEPQSSRWFTTVDSVFVQPVQSNTTGLIVETDAGYSHVMFPWQLEASPRVEFGRESGDDLLGWRVRYWQFRHGQSFIANDANGLLPTGREGVVGYLSEDGDITTGLDFIEEGTFTSTVRTDVIDWELQRKVAKSLDFYAGIRYAKLDQSYLAVTDQGQADARSTFRGAGPTIALRFTHDLIQNKLSLFANLRSSLLFGQKNFTVVDDVNNLTQALNAIDVRDYDEGADSFAGNAELQLGCRFAPADWLAFRVALETQYYGNVGGANPTGVFTGPDSGLAGDSPLDDSLSFVGLSLGTEIGW